MAVFTQNSLKETICATPLKAFKYFQLAAKELH